MNITDNISDQWTQWRHELGRVNRSDQPWQARLSMIAGLGLLGVGLSRRWWMTAGIGGALAWYGYRKGQRAALPDGHSGAITEAPESGDAGDHSTRRHADQGTTRPVGADVRGAPESGDRLGVGAQVPRDRVDEATYESFPASDPPSFVRGVRH